MDQRQLEEARDSRRGGEVCCCERFRRRRREKTRGGESMKSGERDREQAERVNVSTQQLIGTGISVCEH